ncbi:DUF6942 family protein [Colwellia echini]|uniref:Uncharacterized protein n=1 Tax=Colwellia echini TaxID=1982103 RepID=A0ABY3MU53_9GAMM|nr:hypothetical protein [Colwellia echini]TYK64714.1 hypothetical protein CWS31_014160 [Colwellia echini]
MSNIGFGDRDFNFAVYIANKPSMREYQHLTKVMPLCRGEINVINQSCGNGWRKVFNVYAKLLYTLDPQVFDFSIKAPIWQDYRDNHLLQEGSKTALLFSSPQLSKSTSKNDMLHIICGKSHAKALINKGKLKVNLDWLDNEFAIDRKNKVIVCPYFDYRQLSNIKIESLARLLLTLKSTL